MKNKQLINKLQSDPLYFITEILGGKYWEKQSDISQSVRDNKRTSVRSCHGSGKSHISARIALWFLFSHKNSKVITTAPTFRQVEEILWRELRSAYQKSRYDLGGRLMKTSLDVAEEWFALGLSTDEPDRMQGFHAVHILLIMDEAAGIPEEIYDAAEGIISSEHARLLMIGNPTNVTGTFYNSFKQPNYKHIHISAFDTPNFTTYGITIEDIRNNTWEAKITGSLPAPYLVTPEWVYDKFLRWGEGSPMWDSRVLGSFPTQGEDTLIPLAWIEAAAQRSLNVKEDDEEMIGADIARFGADKTELLLRKGPKLLEIKTFNMQDLVQTSGQLRTYMGFHPNAGANIDAIGVGAGVYDFVKAQEPYKQVNAINVAEEPYDKEMFINKRAEEFWGLRQRFESGDIDLSALPPDQLEELMSQLASIKYKFTARGQIQIESKEDMKKRGLPSPDKADALMLSYAKSSRRPSILDYMKQDTQN